MNKTFVKTTNVKNFIGLVENLQNKPKNIPKMGLVYGEPGLGKSQTALWLACKYDAIYLRATNLMTGRWLLEELVKELDEIPRFLTSDNFNLVVKKLKQKPQIIFIDEIDYLINNYKTIETLRDIHDETNCPIIFIGMGLAHRKLERYKHLYDRFSEILKFETFGVNDLSQIIGQLSEITFTPDAIEYIHSKFNRFRQIVQLINQMETFAKDKSLYIFNRQLDKCYQKFARYNFEKPALKIRKLKKRWGSYGQEKNIITLNSDAIKSCKICIDYILTHELCHCVHFKHNKEFYELLEQIFKNWQNAKKKLESLSL